MSFQSSSKIINDVSHEILRAVEELQRGSGFGSVEIVLHEGRVTQIEKREKLRFTHNTNQELIKNLPSAKAVAK
jgi:hypothetical protein